MNLGRQLAALILDEDDKAFAGNFDGQGHTISNLSIGTEGTPFESEVFGLFGVTYGTIKNLCLNNVKITGIAKKVSDSGFFGVAGALAGLAGRAVESCHVTGLIMNIGAPEGNYGPYAYWSGGLVGYLDGPQHIEECSVSGSITETSGAGSIGGFIGELGQTAKITYCSANVALNVKADYNGSADVGGFIGKGNGDTDDNTVISNCYAAGNVTGGCYSGGFAGSLFGLNIKNCYATGDVSDAYVAVATFVGTDAPAPYAYGSIQNCYTTGGVESSKSKYAFAMQNTKTERSPITNTYFVDTNSGIKNEYETSDAKSLAEMQSREFKYLLDADGTNGWIFIEGRTPLCGAEPADYSAVDAALAQIPADLTVYTDESVAALNNAKTNVVKGKIIAKQAEVDAMAADIKSAVDALIYKPADYTRVDEAVARANALNKDEYEDFSGVETAISAVVRDKDITKQAEVDAMAETIENAIAALVKKSFSNESSSPSYAVIVKDTENGSVKASPHWAEAGQRVTLTVTSNEGYILDSLTVIDRNGKEVELTDKGEGNYTFKMPAGKITVSAVFAPKKTAQDYFTDVPAEAYYADAVNWAAAKGITGGVGSNLFAPDLACTRAQIVTFLWRAAGSPEPKIVRVFFDVPADAYYAKAVAWAAENGITGGVGDNKFAPDLTCTRAQAVAFLFRYAVSQGMDAVTLQELISGYSDAEQVPGYALSAFNWALANGTVQGYSNALLPNEDCTRAQIVTMLYRAGQAE